MFFFFERVIDSVFQICSLNSQSSLKPLLKIYRYVKLSHIYFSLSTVLLTYHPALLGSWDGVEVRQTPLKSHPCINDFYVMWPKSTAHKLSSKSNSNQTDRQTCSLGKLCCKCSPLITSVPESYQFLVTGMLNIISWRLTFPWCWVTFAWWLNHVLP